MDSNILLVLLIITSQTDKLREQIRRTVKSLLSNFPDPYLALLNYWATPLPWCSLSPAELLMGRVIRTDVLQHTSAFSQSGPIWKTSKKGRKNIEMMRNAATTSITEQDLCGVLTSCICKCTHVYNIVTVIIDWLVVTCCTDVVATWLLFCSGVHLCIDRHIILLLSSSQSLPELPQNNPVWVNMPNGQNNYYLHKSPDPAG